MFVSEAKCAILRELRHGPLTLPAIGDATGRPPFTIRAELLELKRERLVSDGFYTSGHLWELTAKGCGVAWSSCQLELPR